MQLTDLACRHAKPRSKPYKLFDSGGLYLEIISTGNGYWRQKYRIHGKEKRLTHGSYPALTLIKAREKRDLAKEALQNGVDPGKEKQEKKKLARFQSEQTFEVIAREWHEHYFDTWSKSHSANILYRMELDIFPEIGKIPVLELTTPKILLCLQKIENRGATRNNAPLPSNLRSGFALCRNYRKGAKRFNHRNKRWIEKIPQRSLSIH